MPISKIKIPYRGEGVSAWQKESLRDLHNAPYGLNAARRRDLRRGANKLARKYGPDWYKETLPCEKSQA